MRKKWIFNSWFIAWKISSRKHWIKNTWKVEISWIFSAKIVLKFFYIHISVTYIFKSCNLFEFESMAWQLISLEWILVLHKNRFGIRGVQSRRMWSFKSETCIKNIYLALSSFSWSDTSDPIHFLIYLNFIQTFCASTHKKFLY